MKKLCPRCETILGSCPAGHDIGRCPECGWQGYFRDAPSQPTIAPMKLSYVLIDIETTGLTPETCQILEVGAVFDDWTKPVEELPTFHRIVTHQHIAGQPYALSMHPHLLRLIARPPLLDTCPQCKQPLQGAEQAGYCETCGWTGSRRNSVFCSIQELATEFSDWMFRECGWLVNENKITPAGKNFASFDRSFLKLCGFDNFFHHRTLDPAPLFWRPEDEKLPDSKTCMERAGLDGSVAHTGVADAVAIVRMIRYAAKRILGNS